MYIVGNLHSEPFLFGRATNNTDANITAISYTFYFDYDQRLIVFPVELKG